MGHLNTFRIPLHLKIHCTQLLRHRHRFCSNLLLHAKHTQNIISNSTLTNQSFDLSSCCFSSSLSSRLRIFPDGFFGISDTKITPPLKRFAGDVLSATNLITSASVRSEFSSFTTKANGSSPTDSSGFPITPQSLIFSWVNSKASISETRKSFLDFTKHFN